MIVKVQERNENQLQEYLQFKTSTTQQLLTARVLIYSTQLHREGYPPDGGPLQEYVPIRFEIAAEVCSPPLMSLGSPKW